MTPTTASTPSYPTRALRPLAQARRGMARRSGRALGSRSAGQTKTGRTTNTGGMMMSATTVSLPKRRFASASRGGGSGRGDRRRFASSRRCGPRGPGRTPGGTARRAAAAGGGRRGRRTRSAGSCVTSGTGAAAGPCGASSWPDVRAWVDVAAGRPPPSEGEGTPLRAIRYVVIVSGLDEV